MTRVPLLTWQDCLFLVCRSNVVWLAYRQQCDLLFHGCRYGSQSCLFPFTGKYGDPVDRCFLGLLGNCTRRSTALVPFGSRLPNLYAPLDRYRVCRIRLFGFILGSGDLPHSGLFLLRSDRRTHHLFACGRNVLCQAPSSDLCGRSSELLRCRCRHELHQLLRSQPPRLEPQRQDGFHLVCHGDWCTRFHMVLCPRDQGSILSGAGRSLAQGCTSSSLQNHKSRSDRG